MKLRLSFIQGGLSHRGSSFGVLANLTYRQRFSCKRKQFGITLNNDNKKKQRKMPSIFRSIEFVQPRIVPKTSRLVTGDLSPVNHKGLHQGWKQTSIQLLLRTPHKSRETAEFFKIYETSLDTNMKQHTNIKHTFSKKWWIRYHLLKKKKT